LTHADLTSADFQYADLTSAIFRYADLRKACLRETNLTHASLQDVNLTGADLLDARLHSASFANVEFNGANLTMADFTGASLREANLTGAILGPTAVEPTDVPEADWVVVGLQYEFARRLETKFNDANLTDALFPLDAAVPDGWVRDPSSGRLRRTEKG
jgi:uncharacterized protein YjbI with pentapeptide repeats